MVSVIVVEQEEFRASIARALGRISGEFMRRDSITYSVVFKTQKKKKEKKKARVDEGEDRAVMVDRRMERMKE